MIHDTRSELDWQADDCLQILGRMADNGGIRIVQFAIHTDSVAMAAPDGTVIGRVTLGFTTNTVVHEQIYSLEANGSNFVVDVYAVANYEGNTTKTLIATLDGTDS